MFGMLNSVWGGRPAGVQPNVKATKAADVQPDLNDSDEETVLADKFAQPSAELELKAPPSEGLDEESKSPKKEPKQVEELKLRSRIALDVKIDETSTSVEERVQELELREQQLREELEEALIERDAANAEKEELRRQKDQSSRELQRATRDKDRLQQQKEKQAREINQYVQERSELRTMLMSAQEERDRATEDASSSNRERDRMKRELRDKQDELDALLRQLESVKTRAAQREQELEQELAEVRSALKSRKEPCPTCEAKEERLQALQTEAQALRQRQGQQSDTYLTRIQQLENEVVQLNLQKLLASAMEPDQATRNESENLRAQVTAAQQQLQMNEDAHAVHTQELQTQLAESRDVQLSLAERVKELENEVSRLQQLRAAELNGLHEQVLAFARLQSSVDGTAQLQQRVQQREEELTRSELLRRAMEHELENQHQQLSEAKGVISDLRSRLSNSQRWQSGAELVFQQLQQRCRELELQLEQSRLVAAAGVPVAPVAPLAFAPQSQPAVVPVPWLNAAPKDFQPAAATAPTSTINPHAAPFRSSRAAAPRSQALPIVSPAATMPVRGPSPTPAPNPPAERANERATALVRAPTESLEAVNPRPNSGAPATVAQSTGNQAQQLRSSAQMMEHLFAVLSGCMVELQLKDGTRYQGLFYQKKPSELSIKVVQARLCSSAVHRPNAHSKPRTSLRISACDIVYLAAVDVALLPSADEEPLKASAIEK
eukprot:TRINITY_DN1322_c0_g1_i1.p1 TRINITY_DN1322_c0_g1~~TRINITY_DN1322_c0_g1_i1.p1  ORF type:complete len:737 (-),score=167.48 TRINITY_DN1322_c0_g1_i1:617-2785(-)